MNRRTWVAGKPKKKPDYNSSEIARKLLETAVFLDYQLFCRVDNLL